MAKKSKKTKGRAEKIIIAVALVALAVVIGYAARSKSYKPVEYDIADTKSGRIAETVSLQNELFTDSVPPQGKININTASASQLQRLEGIGETKAKAIIDYREKNGDFQTVEDIMKVSGIGEKTFQKIKDNIEV